MKRLALSAFLLSGCWLSNDFDKFRDAGTHDASVGSDMHVMLDGALAPDLSSSDAAAVDAAPHVDMTSPSDGSMIPPTNPCATPLAWHALSDMSATALAMNMTAGQTVVVDPSSNRMFLLGGGSACGSDPNCTQHSTEVLFHNGTIMGTAISQMPAVGEEHSAVVIPMSVASTKGFYIPTGNATSTQDDVTFNQGELVYTPEMRTFVTQGIGMTLTSLTNTAGALGSDGVPYVVGGFATLGSGTSLTGAAFALQSAGTTWGQVTSVMGTPRADHAVVAFDAHLWAIGGTNGSNALSAVELMSFPPTATMWSPGPSLFEARTEPAAVVGNDGRLYVIGGRNGVNASNSYEVLCNGKFVRPMGTSPGEGAPYATTPRVRTIAGVGLDGRIYVFGGDATGSSTAFVKEIDAYGPGLQASIAGAVATITVLDGAFVASTKFHVYSSGGTALAEGTTDPAGKIPSSFSFPATSGTTYTISDEASLYPIRFTVP